MLQMKSSPFVPNLPTLINMKLILQSFSRLNYVAPELLKENAAKTTATDVFAFALLMYEVGALFYCPYLP